jgi:hypothetical protein
MVDDAGGWVREKRQLPPDQIADAAANPGGWVAEIDASMIDLNADRVPPEAIMGLYEVGPDGKATGDYLRNPGYGQAPD